MRTCALYARKSCPLFGGSGAAPLRQSQQPRLAFFRAICIRSVSPSVSSSALYRQRRPTSCFSTQATTNPLQDAQNLASAARTHLRSGSLDAAGQLYSSIISTLTTANQQETPQYVESLANSALYQLFRRKQAGADFLAEQASTLLRKLPAEPPSLPYFDAVHRLAEVFWRAGKLDRARELISQAIKQALAHHPTELRRIAEAYLLAALIDQRSNPEQAHSCSAYAVEVVEKNPSLFSKDFNFRFACLANLLCMSLLTSRYDAATTLLGQLRRLTTDSDAPKEVVAQLEPAVVELEGALHFYKRQFTRALECFESAANTRAARFGPLAKGTVPAWFNQYKTLQQLGKTVESVNLYGMVGILYNTKLAMDGPVDSLLSVSYLPDLLIVPPESLSQLLK